MSSLLWFAFGVVVGFAIALIIAYVSKARWAKLEKETGEELDKVRGKT